MYERYLAPTLAEIFVASYCWSVHPSPTVLLLNFILWLLQVSRDAEVTTELLYHVKRKESRFGRIEVRPYTYC